MVLLPILQTIIGNKSSVHEDDEEEDNDDDDHDLFHNNF